MSNKKTTNNDKPQSTRLELTADNLVHYLMHAATREDIAELRAENKANIGELRAENKSSISDLRKELKTDISDLRKELKSDINSLRGEFDNLRKETTKHFRWLVGLMGTGFAGMIVFMIQYLPIILKQ